jgi:hypothetical protein
VFCALSEQKVYEPFFFAKNTITGAISLYMVGNWLWPQLTEDIHVDMLHRTWKEFEYSLGVCCAATDSHMENL